MRNIINYTIGKDTLVLGERGEQNANDIVFNGFTPLSDDNTIFFVLDELTYPLMNNTVTVTFPMTAHSGLFVGQLVEKNAEGFVVNKSPVFKVKVTASVEAVIEVTDPRFESLFEEYTRLYNEMLSLESEVREMKADVIESFEQIKAEFERIKNELAQDYADTKSSLIETVRTAIEEADGQIARAKDNALNDINQAKGNALSNITDAKTSAVSDVNQAKDDGINEIETAKADIEQKKSEAIADVITAKADGINDIEQKKTEALADIDEVIQPFEAEYGSIPSEVSDLKGDVADTQRQLAEAEKVNAEQTRKINALEKLTKGTAWSVISAENEAETVDVPSGCYVADIKSVEGKSVVSKNLWNPSNAKNGWIAPNGTIDNSTATRYVEIPCNANDTFTVSSSVDFSQDGSNYFAMAFYDSTKAYIPSSRVVATSGNALTSVVAPSNAKYIVCASYRYSLISQNVQVERGTTATPYEPYFEGIKSADVTDVVVRGANLIEYFDGNSITSNGITYTKNADGSIKVKGTSTGTSSYLFFNRSEILKGEYYISLLNAKQSKIAIQFFDGSTFKEAPLGGSTTKGTFDNSNGYNVSAYIRIGSNITVDEIIYPMLVKGSVEPTTYSPYHEPHRIPIPEAIRNLDGYGWSAGNVCNEVDYEKKQYIQRVGSVDLGSLNWRYNTNQQSHGRHESLSKLNIKVSDFTEATLKLLCPKFISSTSPIGPNNEDNAIAVYSDKSLYIRCDSYTSASDFKTAMQGVPLYYELAEPIVTDISDLLDDEFESIDTEPHGSITFSNENHIAVKSTIEFAQNNAEV